MLAFCWLVSLSFYFVKASQRNNDGFVYRQGSALLLNGEPFQWVSFNTPDLHLLEDRSEGSLQAPTAFEQEDALRSLAQLNGRVTRIYVFSIEDTSLSSSTSSSVSSSRHISSKPNGLSEWRSIPDTYPQLYANEDFFKKLDSSLALASKFGIR
jgi:hypothetical protein